MIKKINKRKIIDEKIEKVKAKELYQSYNYRNI